MYTYVCIYACVCVGVLGGNKRMSRATDGEPGGCYGEQVAEAVSSSVASKYVCSW